MKQFRTSVALMALLPAAAIAQTRTDSVAMQVTFVGQREMLLQDANKQSVWPEARDLAGKAPEFTYRLLPKRINVEPTYAPVGPTRLKVDPPLPLLYGGWVRGGMGTYFTPVLDAGYSSRRSRKGMWGVQLNHRSTQLGLGVPDSVETRFASSGLDAWGRAFRGKHIFDVGGTVGRDAVAYYGIAAVREGGNAPAAAASDRTTYLRMGSSAGWRMESKDSSAVRPQALLSYQHLAASDTVREHTWHGTLGAATRLNGHDASVAAEVWIDRRNLGETRLEQAVMALRPELSRTTRAWQARAGLGIYIDARGDQVFHVYPDLEAQFPLFRGKLTPYAAWGGEVEMNRLEDLLREVPFLDPGLDLRSTYRQVDTRGGIKGVVAGQINYHAEASWIRDTNHLYLRNDSTSGSGERLGAFYDTLSIRSIGGELSWNAQFPLELRAGATLYRYGTSDQLHAWNLPDLAITASAQYLWRDVLKTSLHGRIETGRMGLSQVAIADSRPDAQAEGYVVDLGTLADLDLLVDYTVTGRLSAWLEFRNLLASRYATYSGYRVQGFQTFLGATYTF